MRIGMLLIMLALVVPHWAGHPGHQVHVHRLSIAAASVGAGRHRRPPAWHKRPCQGRGCIDIAILDSSGLCVLCAPSPSHPGHCTSDSLLTYTSEGLPVRATSQRHIL